MYMYTYMTNISIEYLILCTVISWKYYNIPYILVYCILLKLFVYLFKWFNLTI